MDQRSKIFVALGVMFAGVAGALLFRHPSPRAAVAPPGALERLVLQSRMDNPPAPGSSGAGVLSPGGGLSAGPDSAASPFPPPVAEPPDMPRTFTAGGKGPSAAASPGGSASGAGPAGNPLRHKIVDGDTLAGLAAQYLGAPGRAMEIYQSNRELLPSPELLPIGVEIRIPRE